MNDKFLIILGDKDLSSWSLRAWLILKYVNAPFNEQIIKLDTNDTKEQILKYSSSGKVPILMHNGNVIWESLSIAEYLNELFPAAQLWPQDFAARAFARSISNEMHAGFMTLRAMLPFSLHSEKEMPASSIELDTDIKRIEDIWTECRAKYSNKGEYLFNTFSIADAMFAPVVIRLHTYNYQSKVTEVVDYCQKIMSNNFIKEWCTI